jgi:hypothetical protein
VRQQPRRSAALLHRAKGFGFLEVIQTLLPALSATGCTLNFDTKWWAQPQLNFPASTIEVPSGGDPDSSDEFEIKPRWQLIEIWAGDIEHLWPVPSAISEGSGATVGHESAAVKALASHLKIEKQLTRDEAAEWLRKSGYKLGKRAFQRVWTEARDQAGLPRIASPGRKPKTRQ